MRSFGHTRPVRDDDGQIVGQEPSPVRARTVKPLGPTFGADKKHRLIVSLEAGDVISLRPEKTQRPVSITAADLYRYALACQANATRARRNKGVS